MLRNRVRERNVVKGTDDLCPPAIFLSPLPLSSYCTRLRQTFVLYLEETPRLGERKLCFKSRKREPAGECPSVRFPFLSAFPFWSIVLLCFFIICEDLDLTQVRLHPITIICRTSLLWKVGTWLILKQSANNVLFTNILKGCRCTTTS